MERITAEKPTFGYRSVVNERLGDYALIEVAHEITEPKPLLPIPNQKCLPPYLLTEWSTTRTGQ
jgi:hypothetical protein